MTWFRQILHAIGNALLGTRITLQWPNGNPRQDITHTTRDKCSKFPATRTQSSGGLIAKNRPPLSNGVTGPESG